MQAGSLRRARAALMVAVLVASSLTAATALREEPASAAVTPKTALVYGDSLVWESIWAINHQFAAKRGWSFTLHSFPGIAACDFLEWLPADLAAYHPSVVAIETAGNATRPCMVDADGNQVVPGSDEYYARYRSSLDAMFAMVTATGAKVVFVKAPPFLNPTINSWTKRINAIAADAAASYHGVSISGVPRRSVSRNGKYTDDKPCLKTETAAQGCSGGQIPVRTLVDGTQRGLHFCPLGLPGSWPFACTVYSSGEFRFGRALVNTTVSPPKPVLS